jgi:hypothetical protein
MSDKNPDYNKYLSKTTYEKFEKCTVLKKYKVVSGVNIGKVAHVTVKKDKDGKKIYSVTYEHL